MNTVKHALVQAWDKLNPVDPSPAYLVKFMGVALLIFMVGLLIGVLTT